MSFNQILIKADEPLLFHTGMRALFPLVADAVSRVLPIASLRWISFGHVEADECGAMNHWLEAVPDAQVAFRGLGCMVSINDLADRPPRPLDDGESIDLGDQQVRYLAAPHVPHGWEAGVLFEETTSTLPCGDLFTQTGDGPAICNDSPMEPTIAAEDVFGYSTLTPSTAATVERLAGLAPTTLALMHGPTYTGDGEQWLRDLAAMSRAKRRVACLAIADEPGRGPYPRPGMSTAAARGLGSDLARTEASVAIETLDASPTSPHSPPEGPTPILTIRVLISGRFAISPEPFGITDVSIRGAPGCAGLCVRVPERAPITPGRSIRSNTNRYKPTHPISPLFGFGSRRPGVRISPPRPHLPALARAKYHGSIRLRRAASAGNESSRCVTPGGVS